MCIDPVNFCAFYLAKKGGKSVYILGTEHYPYEKTALPPIFFDKLKESDMVLTELCQNAIPHSELVINALLEILKDKSPDGLKELKVLNPKSKINTIDIALLQPTIDLLNPIFKYTKKDITDFSAIFIFATLVAITNDHLAPSPLDFEIANYAHIIHRPVKCLDNMAKILEGSVLNVEDESGNGFIKDLSRLLERIKNKDYGFRSLWENSMPDIKIKNHFEPNSLSSDIISGLITYNGIVRNISWVPTILESLKSHSSIIVACGRAHLLSLPEVKNAPGMLEILSKESFEIYRCCDNQFIECNKFDYDLFEIIDRKSGNKVYTKETPEDVKKSLEKLKETLHKQSIGEI